MIAELPPMSSFSVKSGDRFVDIRLEIKPETEPIPNLKKKKPSPSRLRRNQRRLLMFLEKNKAAESSEPVNTGYKDGSTGEPLLTGATNSAIIERDGPALPNTQIREIDDKQDNNSNPDEEGSNDENECSDEDELSGEDEGSDEDGSTDSEYSEIHEGNYVPNWEDKIWKGRFEKWSDKKWLKYMEIVNNSGPIHIGRMKRNTYFQRWLRNNLNKNEQDEEKETPPDGDEPTTDSLNVTSSSLAAMDVAEMDKFVQDAVLPARSVKVPAKMVQKSLDSEGYVQVASRRSRKKHPDPNACKSS